MGGGAPLASILTWHSIGEGPGPTFMPPATFRAQLAAIADAGCAVVGLEALAASLNGNAALPPRAVILTFDDAFEDFAGVALPALAARGWPSTLFVPAGKVGGCTDWRGVPARAVAPVLGWSALAAVAARGVAIGAHGLTHGDLTRLEPADALREIVSSRAVLEARLGRRVAAFAYPYGRSTPALREAVARHYAVAVGTTLRAVGPDADPYDLPRVDMTYFRDPGRLARYLRHGGSAYFSLRRALRGARLAVRSAAC